MQDELIPYILKWTSVSQVISTIFTYTASPPVRLSIWRQARWALFFSWSPHCMCAKHPHSVWQLHEFCLLRNIRGISVYNSSRSRRSMSMTCIRACWLHPGCVVTTYDSATENCELHETGAEGTPPVTLVNNDGSSVWFIKHPQRSCPKVSFNFKLLSTLSVC